MSTVVCLHGIGQQLEGEHILLSRWTPALCDGVRRAGHVPPNPGAVSMAFYGDLFRKTATKSLGVSFYDESDVTNDWERAIVEAWWIEAARVEQAVPGPEVRTKLRMPHVVQRALNALSHSQFFAGVALRFFIADLKQVHAYLHDADVRMAVQERVANVVLDDTRVVVAHSLGSIVAYEALCAHPEWPVRTLVTLGSPLGIRNLIFEKLLPPPQDRLGAWPRGVTQWTNIADSGDIVALVKELRPCFGPKLYDCLVHNGAHAHDASPYLTAKVTGHAIAQGLAD